MSTDLAAPEQRRRRLVRRHRLRGDAADPVDAARSVLALHATDPATVHLSVLARCHAATRSDVTHALHEDRTLLRMMAMRRTLFVAPTDLAPMLHHAAAVDVAATMRRRLVKELGEQVTDPPVPADAADAWLEDVEQGVARALRQLGAASGVDLSAAEPRLRTAVVTEPGTDREFRRNITSQVLTLMGAEGRIVRGRTLGGWTSRRHVWEPAVSWWPDGLPHVGASEARRALVEA